jgi:hypothetical protein
MVQEALGHTSIAITLDIYSHLVPELQGDCLDHLDSLCARISDGLHLLCTNEPLT